MGFSDKHQVDVVAGISSRAPLKPISTRAGNDDDDDRACSTTPTARESRIPAKVVCPPPPRKRRPTPICHFGGVREFFNPPDLESVFKCHAGRAN